MLETLFIGLIISNLILIPLTIKWELNKKLTFPFISLIGLSGGLIVYFINTKIELEFYLKIMMIFVIIIILAFSLLLWRFFRDPERIPPNLENIILSPADGTVIYIKMIENGKVPFSEKNGRKFSLKDLTSSENIPDEGYLIGIAMSFLDVHINRTPIDGKIEYLKHIKGLFISLKHKKAVLENERVFTAFQNQAVRIGVVQIASRLVRKIVPFVKEGDEVKIGERFGIIKFGSQVDVIIPRYEKMVIKVKINQYVKAGLTILAEFITA